MREAKGLPCGPGVYEKRRGDGEDSSRFETLGRLAHRPRSPKWLARPAPATHSGIVPFSRRVRRFPTTTASARGAPSAGRAFGDVLNGEATHSPRIGGSLVASRSGRGAGRFYISSRKLIEARPPGRPLVNPATAARKARPDPQSGLTTPASSPWARRQRLRPPPRTAPSTPASGKSRRLAASAT